jgi:hypothetical protein
MPADEDLLFGKIALAQGFCTQAHVDECVRMQSMGLADAPVGELLLFKGYITPEQHAKVLGIQKQNLQAPTPLPEQNKEGGLFGRLVLKENLLPEEKVNECLREQALPGEKRTLGEIMVAKGYLSAPQVKDLLARQEKRLMSCPACRLSFTVRTQSKKEVHCPRCKGVLRDGKPSDSTRTDAEFATRSFTSIKADLPAPRKAKAPTTRVADAICVVCDAVFDGEMDSTGRLRCPTCNSTFTPR